MIARLEADGHVLVHRGADPAWSTNSYTVAIGIWLPWRCWHDLPDGQPPVLLQIATLIVVAIAVALAT